MTPRIYDSYHERVWLEQLQAEANLFFCLMQVPFEEFVRHDVSEKQ